jgi:hypothetical protein
MRRYLARQRNCHRWSQCNACSDLGQRVPRNIRDLVGGHSWNTPTAINNDGMVVSFSREASTMQIRLWPCVSLDSGRACRYFERVRQRDARPERLRSPCACALGCGRRLKAAPATPCRTCAQSPSSLKSLNQIILCFTRTAVSMFSASMTVRARTHECVYSFNICA